MAWTYADWITFPTGSKTRLERLRLHIAEITNTYEQQATKYAIHGRKLEQQYSDIPQLLDKLRVIEKEESKLVDLQSGRRVGWTRGRARL